MNNREYLNTLSNEEKAKAIAQLCEESVRAGVVFYDGLVRFLNSPHELTADEMFAEIGFYLHNFKEYGKPDKVLSYGYRDDLFVFAMYKDGFNTYTAETGLHWTDELIDQIRKIAEKKRKELKESGVW